MASGSGRVIHGHTRMAPALSLLGLQTLCIILERNRKYHTQKYYILIMQHLPDDQMTDHTR